ncbi:PH domain-containing protein [Leucobacter sp. gxy201]|uniref:PH domain-containing protein n=1 Tax=Leucobacter sp. gxy201 TaxID=2957200 RepID=UPI003DA193F3
MTPEDLPHDGGAQTGALLPGTADADGWRRLHPLSPLLRGGIVLVVVIGIVVANFRDRFVELFVTDRVLGDRAGSGERGGDILALIEFLVDRGLLLAVIGGLVALLAVIVLLAWLSWRFATYRVTDDAVEARSGVVFRNHRRAPLERIQSVNLQRSLPARVLGLTKIEVVTAGQGGKVALAYLGHRDAKTVREQIIRRAAIMRGDVSPAIRSAGGGAAAPQPAGVPQDPATAGASAVQRLDERVTDFIDEDVDPAALAERTLVRVPVGRLTASIALAWEGVIAVLGILLVVVFAASGAIGLLLDGPDFVAAMSAAVLFSAVPLVLVLVGVMISQFNKGFRFTLSRDGEAVRIGAGLTATATETIPFGRIHAVEARQPLLWRPLGWWRVRITVAGHSAAEAGQNQSQNVVLPVGREDDVLRVIETLLPGAAGGISAGLAGDGADYLGAGRRSAWVLLWGRRRAGIALVDRGAPHSTLRVRRGALTRSLSIMPVVRAQSVQLRRPLVHRMLGLASVQAHTVLGPVRMEMRGLDLAAGRATFDALAAEVLAVQGADVARARQRRGA